MIEVTLQEVVRVLAAECSAQADRDIRGATIDSRYLQPGQLFFALGGERTDGHEYLSQAQAAGASAAVVERFVEDCSLPQIRVPSVRQALGHLAAWWRSQLNVKLIAVTGSNGKTTVKELLASVMRLCGKTLATQGNLNNDLGMPLTLLRVAREHEYAVLEMGANHFGEIEYMTQIARPDIALVNNAGPAHLEGFGDISGVARAKGEIYSGLGREGVAVINADDMKADTWRSLCSDKKTLTFGLESAADISGVWSAVDQELIISLDGQQLAVSLQLLGRHNALNALAATACARAAGASTEQIKAGLEAVSAVDGRLKLSRPRAGLQLIDDSYNANPASVLAGARVAVETAMDEAWLVLGDLGELGDDCTGQHMRLGESLKAAGIARLFTLGTQAAHAAEVFKQEGRSFSDIDTLLESLFQALGEVENLDVAVLVKGSRTSRMERVVHAVNEFFGVNTMVEVK